MGEDTLHAGIGETTFEGRDVTDLRKFIVSKGWSLHKYKSISEYLQRAVVNYDPIEIQDRGGE